MSLCVILYLGQQKLLAISHLAFTQKKLSLRISRQLFCRVLCVRTLNRLRLFKGRRGGGYSIYRPICVKTCALRRYLYLNSSARFVFDMITLDIQDTVNHRLSAISRYRVRRLVFREDF